VQGSSGPSDTHQVTLPAHATVVILQVSFDPHHADSERFTLSLADPVVHLLTDSVSFPCAVRVAAESAAPVSALPAMGPDVVWPLAIGIAAGPGLLVLAARRRRAGADG
jgi:hypothetical protein